MTGRNYFYMSFDEFWERQLARHPFRPDPAAYIKSTLDLWIAVGGKEEDVPSDLEVQPMRWTMRWLTENNVLELYREGRLWAKVDPLTTDYFPTRDLAIEMLTALNMTRSAAILDSLEQVKNDEEA